MMRFEGPALEGIREAVGLSGVGAQFTEYPDGVVEPVFDVGPMIRRGRTPVASSGIFHGSISNVHAGAGAITATVDPYAAAGAAAGWPNPVPPGFDVWLLQSVGVGNSANLVAGSFGVTFLAAQLAFGTAATGYQLERVYNTAALAGVAVGAANYLRSVGDGLVGRTHPVRVARGSTLRWTTDAGAAATFIIAFVLGLFPAGLGQDVICAE